MYRNESLYVDDPEDEFKLVILKHWHALRQLCVFWLHSYIIIIIIIIIWEPKDSFCCSEQGKYRETFFKA